MAKQLRTGPLVPDIRLTSAEEIQSPEILVPLSKMICYSQESGFTRLRLTGGQTLDVKETTERIDELVRQASGGR